MVESDAEQVAPGAQNADLPQQAAQDNLQRIKRTRAAHRGVATRMLRELENLMSVPFQRKSIETNCYSANILLLTNKLICMAKTSR